MILLCSKCGDEKHETLFKKAKDRPARNYRSSWCKTCHCADVGKYQRNNRDKSNVNHARHKKTERGLAGIRKYKRGQACKAAKKRYNSNENGRAASARQRFNRDKRVEKVVNDLTADQWVSILEAQNYKCKCCGLSFDGSNITTRAERDHIIPVMKGGRLTMDNVQALCRSCNASKGTKILEGARHE